MRTSAVSSSVWLILLLLTGGMLVAGGSSALWQAHRIDTLAPRVEIDPPAMVLTAARETIKLEATIKVSNRGQTPLQLMGVQSDCSCTVADWPRVVAPGGTAEIRLTVTPPPTGERHVRVRIESNAANEPYTSAHVLVKRALHAPLALGAPGPVIGVGRHRERPKEPIEATFHSYEAASSKLWIREVVSDSPKFSVTLGEASEKKTDDKTIVERAYKISITLNQNLELGPIEGSICVLSQDGEEYRFRVLGELSPAVIAAPRYISAIMRSGDDELPQWKLMLIGPKGFDLQTNLHLPEAVKSCINVEQMSPTMWRLVLTRHLEAEMRTEFSIDTNHPDCPTVTVPFVILHHFRAADAGTE